MDEYELLKLQAPQYSFSFSQYYFYKWSHKRKDLKTRQINLPKDEFSKLIISMSHCKDKGMQTIN